MKVIIEGHTVLVNKMSIYIDGKMEFQAVNMITEYGQKLNGCRYTVASRYSKQRLEELYAENMKKFSPYIYLTEEEYMAVRDSNNNNNKHHMRDVNNHDDYGYTDELMEIMHKCELIGADPEPDILMRMVEKVEEEEFRKKEELMREALATLPETQRRRAILYFAEGKSYRETAALEGTYHSSIKKSVEAAKKAIEKYFKEFA